MEWLILAWVFLAGLFLVKMAIKALVWLFMPVTRVLDKVDDWSRK